jgi:hypothetical protein
MPIIALPRESGGFAMAGNAVLHIMAVMYFPRDEKKQQAFIRAGHAKILGSLQRIRDSSVGTMQQLWSWAYTYRLEKGFIPAGGFAELANDHQYPDVHKEFEHFMSRGGWVVSDALLYVLQNAEQGNHQEASVNKAIERFEKFMAKSENKNFPLPKERKGLITAWSEFKPAAHLWTANRIVGIEHERGQTDTNVARFLAIAEELRCRAEGFVPKHGKRPIFSPNEVWRTPPDLEVASIELKLNDYS